MLGGLGADFLRWVSFCSIRSSVLGRWFCVTGAALQHFVWPGITFVAEPTTTVHYTNYNYHSNYKDIQLQPQLQLHYFQLHYIALHCVTIRYLTLHYTALTTPPQIQLQLHYANFTAPQLQLQHATTTTTASLNQATFSSCGWGDHCNFNHSNL